MFDPTGSRTPALPGRPARSQSLYRLSYPSSYTISKFIQILQGRECNFYAKCNVFSNILRIATKYITDATQVSTGCMWTGREGIIAVSLISIHFKLPSCCAFVHLTSEFSFVKLCCVYC
jgi:hypothetical protein